MYASEGLRDGSINGPVPTELSLCKMIHVLRIIKFKFGLNYSKETHIFIRKK